MWTVDTLAISVALKPIDHHNVVMTTKNIIAVRKIAHTTTVILSNWFLQMCIKSLFCLYIGRELQRTIVSLVCMQGRTDCREVPTFSRDCPGVDKVSHVLKRSHASFQRAGSRKKWDDSARWENAPKSITVWTK